MFRFIMLFSVAATPVFAHAMLEAASPPVGSTTQAAPSQITLDYSEAVEPRFSTVVVEGPDGKPVNKGDLHTAADDGRRLVVEIAPAGAGTYTVTWHVTSVDTHKTEGRFKFTVSSS